MKKEYLNTKIRKCNLKLFSDDLFYSIQFDHKYLPKWKNIHKNTLDLISKFQTKPSSLTKDK